MVLRPVANTLQQVSRFLLKGMEALDNIFALIKEVFEHGSNCIGLSLCKVLNHSFRETRLRNHHVAYTVQRALYHVREVLRIKVPVILKGFDAAPLEFLFFPVAFTIFPFVVGEVILVFLDQLIKFLSVNHDTHLLFDGFCCTELYII